MDNSIIAKVKDFTVINYSEKAIAIFGDTKPYKDQLKRYGRFNPRLKLNGAIAAGWVFSKKRKDDVLELLNELA